MSALTDLRARITGADGHLLDRGTIAAEMERAIAEESTRAQAVDIFNEPVIVDGCYSLEIGGMGEELLKKLNNGRSWRILAVPAEPELEVTVDDLARTFKRLATKQEVKP